MNKFVSVLLSVVSYYSLCSQNVSFNQAIGSPISNASNERGLTARDVNSDGKIDLLVANLYSDNLRVLLGNGTGQFTDAPGSPLTVLNGPNYLALADFNNDSKLDLVTANYLGNNITILLGAGTGSFTFASNIPTGLFPYCVDVADFNMDGNRDIVTCNVNSNDVYILLGNGSGGFTSAGTPITAGGMPYHVAVADFNLDGHSDFVVANGSGNTIGVYFGNGSGGFSSPTVYATGTQPRTVTLKDLNSDGNIDMSIANALSNNITILLGSSTGTFSSASGSPFNAGGSYPYQCAVADFDLDGKLDISTGLCFSDALAVLLGNGAGNFGSAGTNTLSLASGPQPVVTEDFNGDSKPDLAIGYWYGNSIYVLLNTSTSPCILQSNFSYTPGINGLLTFNNTSSGTLSSTTYTWDYGDSSSSTNFQAPHTYTNSGTYTISLFASNNSSPACVSTSTQVVTISLPNPCNISAQFTYSIGLIGNVIFNNSTIGTNSTTTYFWDFGDLSNSILVNPSHTYLSGGTYLINLTANNNSIPECINSHSKTISIDLLHVSISELSEDQTFRIFPNPNSGILNIISNKSLTASEFILYSTLGEEIYRTNFPSELSELDLTFLKNGIYYFKIQENSVVVLTSKFVIAK